jgi:hypothetical protein
MRLRPAPVAIGGKSFERGQEDGLIFRRYSRQSFAEYGGNIG